MGAVSFLLIVTFTVILVGSCDCTICYSSEMYGSTYALNTRYCSNGCCGYYYSRNCCIHVYVMTLGDRIGLALGCLLAVSLGISIAVCVICIRKNRNQTPGTVLQQGQGQIVVQNQANGRQQLLYPQQQYLHNPAFSQQPVQPLDNPGFGQQLQQPYGNPGFSEQTAQPNDTPGFSQQFVQLHDTPGLSEHNVQLHDTPGLSEHHLQPNDNPCLSENPVEID